MAKATVEREERPVPPIKTVHLTLSAQEAEALSWLFWKIGGAPECTMRGQCDAINEALKGAGIKTNSNKLESVFQDSKHAGLWFIR